ncbi:hypothetical protein KSP39_PZI018031 [Platanthera zijinensis]|uniref:Expansin-like EG45 domain-containing protein n=1 Tax=Platanthera zijinensis TaxID=2320716 RepID=A0AAP0B3B0_9ASPA
MLTVSPCSSAASPPGTMVYAAKAGGALWANGAACGRTYCVMCTGATNPSQPSPCTGQSSIYAIIQAQCSNCGATISLSKIGFKAIANPNAATTITIDYAQRHFYVENPKRVKITWMELCRAKIH